MAAGAARCGGGRGSEGLSAWLALLRHTLAPKKDPTRDARVLGFAGCKIKDSNTRRSTQQVPGLDVGSEVLIVGSMPQENCSKAMFPHEQAAAGLLLPTGRGYQARLCQLDTSKGMIRYLRVDWSFGVGC